MGMEVDGQRLPISCSWRVPIYGPAASRMPRRSTRGGPCEGDGARRTAVLRDAQGGEHWVSASAAPIRDQEGHVLGAVVTATDITALRRVEQELARSREDLERRVAERTEALQRANEALQQEVAERNGVEQALAAEHRAVETQRRRLRAVLDILPVGVVIVGRNGHIEEANAAATALRRASAVSSGRSRRERHIAARWAASGDPVVARGATVRALTAGRPRRGGDRRRTATSTVPCCTMPCRSAMPGARGGGRGGRYRHHRAQTGRAGAPGAERGLEERIAQRTGELRASEVALPGHLPGGCPGDRPHRSRGADHGVERRARGHARLPGRGARRVAVRRALPPAGGKRGRPPRGDAVRRTRRRRPDVLPARAPVPPSRRAPPAGAPGGVALARGRRRPGPCRAYARGRHPAARDGGRPPAGGETRRDGPAGRVLCPRDRQPAAIDLGVLALVREGLSQEDETFRLLRLAEGELERATDMVSQLRDLHRPSEPAELRATDLRDLLEAGILLTGDRRSRAASRWTSRCPRTSRPWRWRPTDAAGVPEPYPERHRGDARRRPPPGATRTDDPAGVRIDVADTGIGILPEICRIFQSFHSTKETGWGWGCS